MAQTSVTARQKKKERMVSQFSAKREALKKAGDWKALDEMPKNSSRVRLKNRCALSGRPKGYVRYFGDYAALDLLPKNASPVRLKNRCQMTGRPKGYMRYFGMSRVMFRDMALNGKIPGLKKASW